MKYAYIFLTLLFLTGCKSNISNKGDLDLQIDIYKNDMTFEKFKQKLIEYAENSSYPSLTNK